MNNTMKFQTIGEVFEWMRMDGSASEALIDCMNAYALSKDKLEKHFDDNLWIDAIEGASFVDGAAQQYYMELGRIEEFLGHQGLIYQD